MLAACPSWDKIVAPGWELGRKRAPISFATHAQIRAHLVDFHNVGEVVELAGDEIL